MRFIKSLVKSVLNRAGYRVSLKDTAEYNLNSMESGLRRMRQMNISPATIVDIGAAQGTWTQKAIEIWPASKFELVEPLVEQTAKLEQLKLQNPGINYRLAVAGEVPGKTWLTVSEDLDGSGVYGNNSENAREVSVITIDQIVKNHTGDFLIKLDTHGYEVPILKGATDVLKRTSLLVIEVYGFRISPTCLLFHELTEYLDKLGFRLIDIVDVMRRPGDKAFWQADAFYIRKEHAVFQKNSYE